MPWLTDLLDPPQRRPRRRSVVAVVADWALGLGSAGPMVGRVLLAAGVLFAASPFVLALVQFLVMPDKGAQSAATWAVGLLVGMFFSLLLNPAFFLPVVLGLALMGIGGIVRAVHAD